MHRIAWTGLLLAAVGCGPAAKSSDPVQGATGGATSPQASSGSSSESGSETEETGAPAPEPEPETIDASDFSRCSPGELDDGCVEGDGHCVCGPGCSEYGPAGVPGRCPLGEYYAVCSEVYTCIVTCTEDAECPDPDMVCRPCPEEIFYGCRDLGSIGIDEGYNGGDMMCTYAAP